MENRGQQALFEVASSERKQSLIKRAAKTAGQNIVKGLFWGSGFAVVVAPMGYIGLQRLESSTSDLKRSVDRFNETVGTGTPQIVDKLGSLDNTAKNFVPSSTTSTVPSAEAPTKTLEPAQDPSDQVAASGPTSTSSSTTTTTAVAGR